MANLPVIFKQGNESTLNSKLSKTAGQLIVTSDGTYGKLWFDESSSKRINIVPHVVDCGEIDLEICCFVAGTQVTLADGTTAPIESLKKDIDVNSIDDKSVEFKNPFL